MRRQQEREESTHERTNFSREANKGKDKIAGTVRSQWTRRRRSTSAREMSARIASSAAGMAPARMTASLTMATPRKMNVPRPPAPMAAAMVATPMVITVAVRMPARIIGKARGKPHASENLCVGHAHGFGGFQDGGIDAGETDVGIAENGKQRVKNQRDDGGAAADAADERDGNQETEQREAGDGLKNAGDAEREGAQCRALHDEHAQRHADEDGDEHGDQHQRHVIECGVENFRAMRYEKCPRAHAEHSRHGLQRSGEGFHFGMIDAQKFPRRGAGDDAAFFEQNDARGQQQRFTEIVGDEHDGFAQAAREVGEFALQFRARDGIERAEGLVHQEDRRIGAESARNADPLSLAAGKLGGASLREFARFESYETQQFVDAGLQCARNPISPAWEPTQHFRRP